MKAFRYSLFLLLMLMLLGCSHRNPYQKKQEELAKNLGINIEDYPYPLTFPAGYFYTILEKGMTLEEVHSVIIDYQEVYHCQDYEEIYYYFSSDDDKALRFRIFINPQDKTFERLQGEDTNSRTIIIDDCKEGKLE